MYVRGKEKARRKTEDRRVSFPRDASSSKCQIPAGRETKVPYMLRMESINGNNASCSPTTSSTTWSGPPWRTPLPSATVSSRNRLSPCDDAGGREPLTWLAYPQTTYDRYTPSVLRLNDVCYVDQNTKCTFPCFQGDSKGAPCFRQKRNFVVFKIVLPTADIEMQNNFFFVCIYFFELIAHPVSAFTL